MVYLDDQCGCKECMDKVFAAASVPMGIRGKEIAGKEGANPIPSGLFTAYEMTQRRLDEDMKPRFIPGKRPYSSTTLGISLLFGNYRYWYSFSSFDAQQPVATRTIIVRACCIHVLKQEKKKAVQGSDQGWDAAVKASRECAWDGGGMAVRWEWDGLWQ